MDESSAKAVAGPGAVGSADATPENAAGAVGAAEAAGAAAAYCCAARDEAELGRLQDELIARRAEIDAIDAEIVQLLNARARESLQVRSLKQRLGLGLYDPQREEQIFRHIESLNEGPLYNGHLDEIYTCLLRVMKQASGPQA